MKNAAVVVMALALYTLSLRGQGQSPAPSGPAAPARATQSKSGSNADAATQTEKNSPKRTGTSPQHANMARAEVPRSLEQVLDSMDRTAADFRTAQADFVWDQYESVVQEHTKQMGVMYIRKSGNNIDLAADITQPPDQRKYVLFTGGKVQLYQPQPALDQVTTYAAGKNREAFQSFLVLGFGARGHDLSKQFDVKYAGNENLGGIETAKLELVPKSDRVRGMFDHILLWIDTSRGVSVQQQFFEPVSGNYRLAQYSNIRINEKIPDTAFRLKTTNKTKFVTP